MESTAQTEHRAAAWLARRDSGEWSAADESALHEWLESSTVNRVSFLRLESVWEESLRLKALTAGMAPGAGERSRWRLSSNSAENRPVRAMRATMKMVAVAAAMLAVVGVACYFSADLLSGQRYATPVGGLKAVPLQDGSSITLNTATRIRVELTARERHIELDAGEAFFDVAKDPTRPFVVSVGRKRVIAVGTQFSVRREEGGMRVVVTDGRVRIEDKPASEYLVEAGSLARSDTTGVRVQKRTAPENEALLSWRAGYLTFRDTPLGEAIAEFNAYNRQQITTGDPAVAAIPLTGKFRATNYEAFVRLLQEGYSIRAARVDGRIVLSAATGSH